MKNNPSKKSKITGKHYKGIPCETIDIIESVVERDNLPSRAAYCIGNALKYLCRCGLKEGEDWKDDVEKAENYLHRAITGEWKNT